MNSHNTYSKKMNDTQRLVYLYIQTHQGYTAEGILNLITEVEADDSALRRKELSDAYGFLVAQDYVKVNNRTLVVSVWGEES